MDLELDEGGVLARVPPRRRRHHRARRLGECVLRYYRRVDARRCESVLVRSRDREHGGANQASKPRGAVYALCLVRDGERVLVLSAATPVGGDIDPHEIRVTMDGSEPTVDAVRYEMPLVASGRVRAALLVAGRRVVEADLRAPRFRMAGSTAPTRFQRPIASVPSPDDQRAARRAPLRRSTIGRERRGARLWPRPGRPDIV